ncbi:MAG: F0F1 ATP synthase subunit B [Candidatus Levyibacteriota bacterium]|nr:MAG: F0F1 ATP synthase subunit B [Candidatus Levybacteria bacterium]
MEILNTFGVDIKLLIAQVINFLIVLFLLRKLLYKPLLSALEDRKNTIAKGLQQAEEGRLLLEKAAEKEKIMLQKAEKLAKKLLDETKEQKLLLIKQAEEVAKNQADRILKEARTQIVYETKEAKIALSSYVSELAVQFLQKSLTGLFSEKEQHEIVKTAARKIKQKNN